MKIVIATNNTHKVREIERILPQFECLTPADIGVRFSYAERGATFMANAMGKARHCLQAVSTRYAVIADDSGICVAALDGKPGIYSARFGREHGIAKDDDDGRNALLISALTAASARDSNAVDRSAHYVCAAVLIDPLQRIVAVQERWDGAIAAAASDGTRGFGYDPIFIPREAAVTVAELADDDKDRYSHRAKALRALAAAYRTNGE